MWIIKDRTQLVLVVVGIILLVLNIFLIVQNSRLKTSLEQSKQSVTEEGYTFSSLKLKQLDGLEEDVNLADGQHTTLLLVFNTGCEYCLQQYPNWNQLTGSLDQSRWRVLAISSESDLDKIKNHLTEHKVINVKAGSVSPKYMVDTRMLFTPMTLVIDPAGNVKKVWAGLWKKDFEIPN